MARTSTVWRAERGARFGATAVGAQRHRSPALQSFCFLCGCSMHTVVYTFVVGLQTLRGQLGRREQLVLCVLWSGILRRWALCFRAISPALNSSFSLDSTRACLEPAPGKMSTSCRVSPWPKDSAHWRRMERAKQLQLRCADIRRRGSIMSFSWLKFQPLRCPRG